MSQDEGDQPCMIYVQFSSNRVAVLYLVYILHLYTLYCVVMLVVLLLNCLSDMQVHLALLHLPMFLLVRMAAPISCVLSVKPQME